MTQINRTKLLAVLAVTAMALVPIFTMIDSDNSSASGEPIDVTVTDWDTFKKAMDDARAAPEDTFNVTLTVAILVSESITIPENVKITLHDQTAIMVESLDGSKVNLVNEGEIVLEEHVSPFGYSASIGAIEEGSTFVNNGKIIAKLGSTIAFYDSANLINNGTITFYSWYTTFGDSKITNHGTMTFVNEDSYLMMSGKKSELTNWSTIDGEGGVGVMEGAKAVNLGVISCRVAGNVIQQEAVWDTSRAGKTIYSEGFRSVVKDSDINEALKALGDKTVEDVIQDSVNKIIEGDATVRVTSADVNLELVSNYIDAEYPNNMILRTAFFKVTVELKMSTELKAQLPDAGTYSFNDKPATSEKTIAMESTVSVEGLLRVNAYFDAGEKLQRVDVSFGLGLKTVTNADIRLDYSVIRETYTITYDRTRYDLGMSTYITMGLDFNGFDLFSYNPGDEWDVMATIKVDKATGYIDLTGNTETAKLLRCLYWNTESETTMDMILEIYNDGRTTVDLTELFDVLFGPTQVTAPVSGTSGAAVAPFNDSASNGMFGTLMFSARASMGDDGYVTLTRGNQSAGALDLGEVIFDALETEGETSVDVSTDVSGSSMMDIVTATVSVFAEDASQEEINEVLKDLGAEYSESTMSVKQMDKVCDQSMNRINRYGGAYDNNSDTGLFIAIGVVAAMAAVILISMFVRRD